jgi:NADH-quinone oxidoreductase subunit C
MGDRRGVRVITVDATAWVSTVQAAHDRGLRSLDLLTAVDRGTHIEVIVRVLDPLTGTGEDYSTMAINNILDSISSVYPGAVWHERETAEMFGVRFEGLADERPLLLRAPVAQPPLLASALLLERAETPWPGSAEPGGSPGRRRLLPPGVPEDGSAS